MRVLVYGGGAVGLGVASCLIKAGAAVDIIARPRTVSLLRDEGLVRTGLFGTYAAAPSRFGAFESLDDIIDRTYDFVLVCVKSADTDFAARDLSAHGRLLGERGLVVHFQNGWGNAEVFAERLGQARVYSGRVITGFIRPAKNRVDITVHADAIHVGSLFGAPAAATQALCAAIAQGGIPCVPSDQIGRDLWAKMLYNCALNPLGAVFNVPYGVLADCPDTRAIMDAVHGEAFAVMQAAGHATHWPSAVAYRQVFYGQLVPPTAAHESSMLQDLRAGRRTEIEAMNGALVRLGRETGIDTPVNTVLRHMVKFLEARHLTEKEVRHRDTEHPETEEDGTADGRG